MLRCMGWKIGVELSVIKTEEMSKRELWANV
jgi:hypothetical protein